MYKLDLRNSLNGYNVSSGLVLAACGNIGKGISLGIFSSLNLPSVSEAYSCQVIPTFSDFPLPLSYLSYPWFRLYVHALLRGSRIFPGVALHDDSPDYTSIGFADVWKGNYRGNPVFIKAIRTQKKLNLNRIKWVNDTSV